MASIRRSPIPIYVIAITVAGIPGWGQAPAPTSAKGGATPVYNVTVIERNTKAVNYRYRSGPTKIDLRGTVLLPDAHGEATVESTRGRTEIEAKIEKIAMPQRFGAGYLTYVLWALTPEGGPRNLGQVLPNASGKVDLHVTTDLQTFALIVTAEPYSAVRRPSDLVVMENEVRRGTKGNIELVDAKYELLPRGTYTWQVPVNLNAVETGPKLSENDREALVELYQAQNALGIARSARADSYAPETFSRAQQLFDQARQLQDHKAHAKEIVPMAREAAQTAEDARAISEQRQSQEQLTKAQSDAAAARETQARLEAEATQLKARIEATRAEADADRAVAERATNLAAAAAERANRAEARARQAETLPTAISPATAPPPGAGTANSKPRDEAKSLLRTRLLAQFTIVGNTLDTPRGLVVTLPDRSFAGAALREEPTRQIEKIGQILVAQPTLTVQVEGHSDSDAGGALALQRAQAVRAALVAHRVAASRVTARGWGDSRPVGPNATPGDREQNRRVELVISGDSIGDLPLWDRTYPLAQRSGNLTLSQAAPDGGITESSVVPDSQFSGVLLCLAAVRWERRLSSPPHYFCFSVP